MDKLVSTEDSEELLFLPRGVQDAMAFESRLIQVLRRCEFEKDSLVPETSEGEDGSGNEDMRGGRVSLR